MKTKPEPMLYLSDARGIYIPRDFAADIKRECISGVTDDVLASLADPNSELYWDAWGYVLDNARVTDPATGIVYAVYQDGDCWLIPDGMAWDDAAEFYVWPTESDDG